MVFILSIMIIIGCSEDLLNLDNPNQLSQATFFESDAQAIAATNAAYAALQTLGMYSREYFFLHDLLSDENRKMGSLEIQRGQLVDHVFDPGNVIIQSVWQGVYRGINRTNFVIESISEAENVTPDLRTRLEAEARFLRALYYFELVSLFGDVPLLLEQAKTADGIPRSSEEEVYSTIFGDLDFAEQNLPNSYDGGDLGRATKFAAIALKGKARLFRGEYAQAGQELEKVISSNQFNLVDNYFDNFTEETENNVESIWEIQLSTSFGGSGSWSGDGSGIAETTFRGQEYGWREWRNVTPSSQLVADFEDGDPRLSETVYRIGDTFNNGTLTITADIYPDELPSWKKYQNHYKQERDSFNSGINFRVIRYADVLLMMAEAINQGNYSPGSGLSSDPLFYMNQVRQRPSVNMPAYPTSEYPANSADEIFRAIAHERMVEFAGEQIRNRDIRRWRRAGLLALTNQPDPIPQFRDFHDLLPIPQPEIDNNDALTNSEQNPGY